MNLHIRWVRLHPLHRLKLHVHLHGTSLENLPVPELLPALGRMAEHMSPVWIRLALLNAKTLLRTSAMRTEYEGSRERREEPCEGLCELKLLRFTEEMEEGGGVDDGDVSVQGSERSQSR